MHLMYSLDLSEAHTFFLVCCECSVTSVLVMLTLNWDFTVCVSGKSTFAVQADFQTGGQILWWVWRCGPVPSSKHLGEPLVRATDLLSSDLLLPLDLGWSCPSSLAQGKRFQTPVWCSKWTWEASCGNQLLPCAFLRSLPVLIQSSLCSCVWAATFSSSNNQFDANCLKHWFNAVTLEGTQLSLL